MLCLKKEVPLQNYGAEAPMRFAEGFFFRQWNNGTSFLYFFLPSERIAASPGILGVIALSLIFPLLCIFPYSFDHPAPKKISLRNA
jgi:hypothetical protein